MGPIGLDYAYGFDKSGAWLAIAFSSGTRHVIHGKENTMWKMIRAGGMVVAAILTPFSIWGTERIKNRLCECSSDNSRKF